MTKLILNRKEGFNPNCHGNEWADNTEQKLAKLDPNKKYEFEWISRCEKTFQGIGPSVKTFGKRKLPSYLKLRKGRAISLQIESHEQKGRHPILLSDASQGKLGMLKDMRTGQVKMIDYDDDLEVCRTHGSGLKVICISNCPSLLTKAIAPGKTLKSDESLRFVTHPATGN